MRPSSSSVALSAPCALLSVPGTGPRERERAHSDSGLGLLHLRLQLPGLLRLRPRHTSASASASASDSESCESDSSPDPDGDTNPSSVPAAAKPLDDWKEACCRRNVAELLARQVLCITCPPPLAPLTPLLVEDPPSTADEEDDEFVRVCGVRGAVGALGAGGSTPRHAAGLLNGSSGNISTKSAPATPVGERLQGGTNSSNWSDRRGLRQRGSGTGSGTGSGGTGSVAPASSTPALVALPSPGPSKARHKKFHRHFDSVAPDERVLNFYSCALVGDILLQGHLYITSNYFAFYSNVFGYVTKLLIPTASVLRVSKEKTARFIPNAIGVATPEDKHVFGSLLSRDNTYKLMVQVWKCALGPGPPAPVLPKELKDDMEDSASGDVLLAEDDDSSLSGSGVDSPVDRKLPLDKVSVPAVTAASGVRNGTVTSAPLSAACVALSAAPPTGLEECDGRMGMGAGAGAGLRAPSRPTMVLAASTALLILLFLSAAFMLYRISLIQDQFRLLPGDDMYQDLARWQSQLHSRSASQVEEFLNTHLDQLAKVRQSLEALSLLIVSKEDHQMHSKEKITGDHNSFHEGPSPVEEKSQHQSWQHSTKNSKGS